MKQEKTSSLLNELKSHPDKSLFNHLKNVGDLSKKTIKSKKLNLGKFIDSEILEDISYLIGITHDFGKATDYFQRYINEEDEKIKFGLKNKLETHHAFLSSLFTYYVVKDYLSGKGLLEKKYYKYLPIISFLVVKRHHGNIDNNASDETYDCTVDDDDEKFEIIKKQIVSIDFDELHILYKKLCFDYEIKVHDFRDNYNKIVDEINTKQKRLIRKLDDENTLVYYFTTLLLYSVLLDTDKTDAANLKPIERKDIDKDVVDKYKKNKFGGLDETNKKSKINEIRENIYNEVISSVNGLNLANDKILSLNVPTGTGKTLTSLSFALKLRERLKKEKGLTPRIIYSLPFLSIIDQNSDVFNDVLDNPTTDILLKHHHLSDISYKTENEFENVELERDISKSLLLIEGWNSEIIVTTFMQFFHSFITNRNRAIRKFHNISNSIVILDEVQAIPHKYWLLLKEAIKFFAEYFNTYFIFVTATEPLIFDEQKKEIKPLIKNKEEYFELFDRVTLIPNLKPLCINDFKELLKEDILQNPQKDFLIVMNTINSSKEIYNFIKNEYLFIWDDVPGNDSGQLVDYLVKDLKLVWARNAEINKIDNDKTITVTKDENSLEIKLYEKEDKVILKTCSGETHEYISKKENSKLNIYKNELSNNKNTKIYYLSTGIFPKERLKRIKDIKEKTKERKIIVSTQLIEAGVDIDVDVVYRDFAPLDSINQVAGRCNRNFGDKKGRVMVFILTEKEKTKKYYSYTYDSFITAKTDEVFKENEILAINEQKPINEPKFLELNNSYFEKVESGMSNDESNEILKSIKELNFEKISEFKLIEEEPYKVDVFIEVDDKAKEVMQKYKDITNNDKLRGFEKKNEFLKIKKDFYDYVISVDKKKTESLSPLIGDQLSYISNKDLKDWYKPDTGFDPSQDASFNRRVF